MKHLTTSLIIGACLLVSSAGVVFADPPPHGSLGPHPGGNAGLPNGQPGTQPAGTPQTGASCGTLAGGIGPPGQAISTSTGSSISSSTNSPFALDAMGMSKNYAGSADAGSSSKNAHANSQYDVACFQPH
jgi:hypothetical protein